MKAYDCYDAIEQQQAKSGIPPRKDAKIHQHSNRKAPPHLRAQNLRRIRKVGRKRWQQESHYHRRSLAKTVMFRFKAIFGGNSVRVSLKSSGGIILAMCGTQPHDSTG